MMLFLLVSVLLFNISYSFWNKKDTNTNINNGIRGVLTHYQSQYNGNDDSNDAR